MATAAADTIVAISQAEAVVPAGFGAALGAVAGLGVDGSVVPVGTPSRVRAAVSRGLARSHPLACSGWPKPCCPGGV
jgi:hypothetical protein